MALGIAIANHKGGTGKTSISINLASAFASLGKRVLVVDLAPRADLTVSLGFEKDAYDVTSVNIVTLLCNITDPGPLIRSAPHDAFNLLARNVKMHFAEQLVVSVRDGEWQLKRSLQHVEEEYDIILADCPPVHNTVTDISLLTCPRMLIPARMHPDTQRSIATLIDQTDSLAESYGAKVKILGIVPVAQSSKKDQEEFFRMLPGQEPTLAAPALRPHEALIDSARRIGHSIFSYEPKTSDQKQAQRECQADYLAPADFVLQKSNEVTRTLEIVSSDSRPRKHVSFRMQKHLEQAVKEIYWDLREAGVSVSRADVWEELFRLGLKYSDELTAGYFGQEPAPRKPVSIRLREDVIRALELVFLDLSRAGAPDTQADVREGLLMIGLKYRYELDESYLGRR